MSKRGSALMQVMVIGLIVAAFSVMILRYAITRSANLTRTDRILQSQIIADSCLEQYMAYIATAELYGMPYSTDDFQCSYFTGEEQINSVNIASNWPAINNVHAVTFSVPVSSSL